MNIPLGRLAGIKVTMDPTVLVLAAVYSVTLAEGRFPTQNPGLSTTAYWVAGVSGALLFFASLLAHELGHALVAKDEGIGVLGISLWLLGGMAKLESSPTTARSEFRIAIVGPLASAACGVTFLCSSYVLGDSGIAGLAGDLFQLLGFLNLVLAVFNLIPAAPLDGGTVLASAIWKRTGSQATGMKVAAYVGVAVGAVMIWKGFDWARSDNVHAMNGWSLVAVGAFIIFAAMQSLRAQPLFSLLDGVTVAESMEPSPPAAPASASVGDFLRSLPSSDASHAFPVVDDRGVLWGVLTAEAIRSARPESWDHLRVDQLAFSLDRIVVVRDTDLLLPSVQKIDGGPVRQGLVADASGNVVGTIDARSLFRTVERRKAELATTT